MKFNKYILRIKGIHGSAILVYQDGDFKSFLTEVKPPFTAQQLKWLLAHIPAKELMLTEQLVLKAKGAIEVKLLQANHLPMKLQKFTTPPLGHPSTGGELESTRNSTQISVLDLAGSGVVPVLGTNIKIALFCRMYEKYTTVKYKVSPADSGKIKLLNVDDALLKHYFTSQNFLFKNKYSIANLCKYYNELLAEIATQGKSQYPNHYDKAYEAKLPLSQISGYWLHLRSLGLKPKKDRLGNTVDWVITQKKDE